MNKWVKGSVLALGIGVLGVQTFVPLSNETFANLQQEVNYKKAKNVILLIPDGMGSDHVTAYRNFKGKPTVFDTMPVSGSLKTHSANAMVTDSAAAGTAIATGIKTNNGVIGMTSEKEKLNSILVSMETAGKKTGLIATSTVTHATPASFASHDPSRSNETKLAPQLFEHDVDVVFGGGQDVFATQLETAEQVGYTYVDSAEELQSISKEDKVLGLFAKGGLEPAESRPTTQPSLTDMTTKAIDLLKDNKKGFFIMSEGSQIDWESHANDEMGVLKEMEEFENTVQAAINFAKTDGETLVLVVPDHETGGVILDGSTDNASGMKYTSGGHTAGDVPIYAYGAGSSYFNGTLDNTQISTLIAQATKVKHSSEHYELPVAGTKIETSEIISKEKNNFIATQGKIDSHLREGAFVHTITDKNTTYVQTEKQDVFSIKTTMQDLLSLKDQAVVVGKRGQDFPLFAGADTEVGTLYKKAQSRLEKDGFVAEQAGNRVVVKKDGKQVYRTNGAGDDGLLRGLAVVNGEAFIVVEHSKKGLTVVGNRENATNNIGTQLYDTIQLP